MTAPALSPARAFLALTERMLERARAGDWTALAALQRRREGLQRAVAAAGPDPLHRPELERAQALQHELERLLASERAALGRELRARGRARRAAARYVAAR